MAGPSWGERLRPGRVLFTTELPKTRNAKVMRRPIWKVASGSAELGDTTGLRTAGDRGRAGVAQAGTPAG